MADDCMGLAQQVAYSSLLAFFPAVVALLGLLGLLNAYDALAELPRTRSRRTAVIRLRSSGLQKDSRGGGPVVAFVIGMCAARLGGERRDGLGRSRRSTSAYDRMETRPFWKVRADRDRARARIRRRHGRRCCVLIVFGGTLGDAIAHKAHSAVRSLACGTSLRWPIAFVLVLLLFALVYWPRAEHGAAAVGVADAGRVRRRGLLWLVLSRAVRALHDASPASTRRPTARSPRGVDPAALAELHGVGDSLRRRAQLGARPPGGHPRRRRGARRADEPARRKS